MTWSDVPGEEALPNLKDSGEGILQLGKGIANAGAAMQDTQVIAVGGEVEGWTGLAATAHQGQATFLQKAIQKAIDLHPKIPALLDKYVQEHAKTRSAITGLQHDWDEARTVHLRRIAELAIQLKAGLYPGDDDEYEKDRAKADEACEKTQKEVKAKYEAAVRSLNELAKSTGDSIFGLAESFAPKSRVAGEGSGSIDRNNLGVELFGGSGGVLAAQARWEDARADADKAAKVFLTKDGKLKGNVSQKDLDSFNAAYGKRMAKDPFFANAFAWRFGANNAIKLVSQLDGSHGAFPQETVQATRTSIGSAIILGTGGIRKGLSEEESSVWNAWNSGAKYLTSSDGTLIDESRDKYLDDLKKAGNKRWIGGANLDNAGASGYMLISGTIANSAQTHSELALGDPFLNGPHAIGRDIVKWDYENPQEANNYHSDIYTPKTTTWDPVHNMLVAMDGNPDAARTFLASDGPYEIAESGDNDDQVKYPISMTRYLVGNRHFVPLSGTTETLYVDRGKTLANLLDEVSSDKTHKESSLVARDYLQGYTDGLKRSDATFKGQDAFGYGNVELREKAGDILKEYSKDLASELKGYTGVPGAPHGNQQNGEYSLSLTKAGTTALFEGKSDFFKDIGASKSSMKTLTESLEANLESDLKDIYGRAATVSHADSANIRQDIKETCDKYQSMFSAIKGGGLASDAAQAGELDRKEATTANAMSVLVQKVGHIPVIGEVISTGYALRPSVEFNDHVKNVYQEHNADNANTSADVSTISRRMLSHVIVNNVSGWQNELNTFNNGIDDEDSRFMDRNGNWLIKIDPNTGKFEGDRLRVQQYNRFLLSWRP